MLAEEMCCGSGKEKDDRFSCCLLITIVVFLRGELVCRGRPGGHLLSLLRQRKKAKKGDRKTVPASRVPKAGDDQSGTQTNSLRSNMFAPFIRLTTADLGNVPAGKAPILACGIGISQKQKHRLHIRDGNAAGEPSGSSRWGAAD